MSTEDDLIVFHPNFVKGNIQVCDGRINCSDPQPGTEKRTGTLRRQTLLEGMGLSVQLWTMRIKWYFPILITAIGIIIPTTLSILNSSGKPCQDWAPIDLPSKGTYGFLKQDRSHPEGVRFRFSVPWQGQNKLTFTPGSESAAGSLRVSLDGQDLLTNILLPQGWGSKIHMTIPSSFSQGNSHILEIRPHFPKGVLSSWGVKDVRIVPFRGRKNDSFNMNDNIERVQATLRDPMAQGADLSHCYLILNDRMQQSRPDDANRLPLLKQEVKKRMFNLASGSTVRIRSFIFSGQHAKARRLMSDLREWIPETWTDGQKMLGELDQLFSDHG